MLGMIKAARKTGFTLIEFWAVIAMIAILAAMLLPTLSKAQEEDDQAKCISNLKQLAQACVMYANDHDGWAPDYALAKYPATGWNYCWPYLLTKGGYTPAYQDNAGFASADYPARGIYACPGQKNPENGFGVAGDGCGKVVSPWANVNVGNRWYATHYGMNSMFCYWNDPAQTFHRTRLNGVKNANRMILLADICDQGAAMTKYPSFGAPYLILRHGGNTMCNIAFADGHVETITDKWDYNGRWWSGSWD